MEIQRTELQYISERIGLRVHHCILTLKVAEKRTLLSLPNLFLYETTRQSINTSKRYASILKMFYEYLLNDDYFKSKNLHDIQSFVTDETIQKWQVHRQAERLRKKSRSPSSETIFIDAAMLLSYFAWMKNKMHIPINVSIQHKVWAANFKDNRMLNYLAKSEKYTIDTSKIKVLDQERHQRRNAGLITQDEIELLINSYDDCVYVAMFSLAIGTAMRPSELCNFPYIGNGDNSHILPYSSMKLGPERIDSETIEYKIVGAKGNKTRTIRVHVKDLKAVEEIYTSSCYNARKRLYEKRHGKPCPLGVLFLNKHGQPVSPEMISSRTYAAKKKILSPKFNKHVNFYHTRHWWPTYFLINFYKEEILSDSASVFNAAAAEIMRNQLGHEDIETTYKYYIEKARILMLARKGYTSELIRLTDQPVVDFILGVRDIDQKAG